MQGQWSYTTLLDGLARRGNADAAMAVHDGVLEVLSGAELARRVRAVAGGLARAGVEPGAAVVLAGPNGFAWLIARLALGACGALAVPVDAAATAAELGDILRHCKATRVICPAAMVSAFRATDPNLTIIAFGGEAGEGTQSLDSLFASAPQAMAACPADAPEMLAHTSGTTGAPKAIVLSHANIAANVAALVGARLVDAADRVLIPLPLQHVYPFVVGVLAGLASGATIVFPQSLSAPDILEAMRLSRASVIVGVPRLYTAICAGMTARAEASGFVQRMLFRRLLALSTWLRRRVGLNAGRLLLRAVHARFGGRLRLLVSGGARLDDRTLWQLVGLGFEIRSGYGLAETASMFTANYRGSTRWRSEGKPFTGEVRIAAADASGAGEIQLKGPQVFTHYLDNPDATRAIFTSDGWLRTGDLGRIDADGFLYVTGRARDLLVLGGGKKADPEVIEKIYGDSPYIGEIAVLEHQGKLVALVVPKLDAIRAGGAVHIDTAIRIELASRAQALPSYQRLSGFAIVREPLPRTRLGKFRRFMLGPIYERAQRAEPAAAAAPPSPEDQALLEQPLARQIFELLRARYPHRAVSLDTNLLLDLGIDSLEWVSLALELEDRLGLHLAERDIGEILNVRDLVAAAMQAPAASASAPSISRDWAAPMGLALQVLGACIYAVNWVAMRALFRLRVSGREHVPANASFILIANHASYLDAPALAAALNLGRLRKTYWAGDPKLLFVHRWQEPVMRAMHCYPLDERLPASALAVSEALLKGANNLVWFPEGWRSPDGELQPFLPGIGQLLMRMPVPVVPAHIAGSFAAWPRESGLPKLRRIEVVFGRPIVPSAWQELTPDGPTAARNIARALHDAVATLGAVSGASHNVRTD